MTRHPSPHRCGAAALGLVVLAVLALAPAAPAAQYVVVGCADPAGLGQPGQVARPTDGWVPEGVAPPGGDGCAAGAAGRGMLAFSGGPFAGYQLAAPPGTRLTGFWVWYAAHLPAAAPGAAAGLVFDARAGDAWSPVAPANDWLAPAALDLSGVWAHTDLGAADGLRFGVRCTPGPCRSGDEPRVEVHSIGVALDDPQPPVIAAPGGSLLAAGAQRGARQLTLSASDEGGGLARLTTTAGGRVVDDWTGCASLGGLFASLPHYDRRIPCPPSAARTITVDTTALPDGAQPVDVRATDAAGNVRTASVQVLLDNHPPSPGSVTVAGIPRAGERLQAITTGFDGQAPTLAFTWQRCSAAGACRSLPAHEDTFLLGSGDAGRRLRVRVIAADGGGTTVAYSPPTDPIAAVPAPAPSPPAGHVPNGHRADAHATVSAWLEDARGRHGTRATGRAGTRIRIRGVVEDAAGRPINGATLSLVESRGGQTQPITDLRTRSGGRFTTATRIGPSRTLRVSYLPFSDSRRPIRSRALRLTVRR